MKKTLIFALICLVLLITSWKHESDIEKYKEVNVSSLDTSIKAQDNFYQYINGIWLKNNSIPPGETYWDNGKIISDTIFKRLRKLFEDAAANTSAQPGSMEQMIGDFYACGIDSVSLNKNGITPLQSEFQRINEITDNKSLWREIAHLVKLGPGAIFEITVGQDDKNSSKLIMAIGPTAVSMGDLDNYLIIDSRTEKIREKFLEDAQQLFVQMGEPEDLAMKNAKIVLETETQLAKSCMTSIEKHNVTAQYNKKSIAELKKLAPDINWSAFFETLGSNPDTIIAFEPLYIKQANNMAKSVSLDKWKVLLRFKLIDYASSYLRGSSYKWKRSVKVTNGELGQLVGQLYISKYFNAEAKEKVNEMVTNIIEAYKQRIEGLDWMSNESKKTALTKLEKITRKLCYPDKWKDYSGLIIKRDSWILNLFRINEFEFNNKIKKLGKPIDRTLWDILTPQTVMAAYRVGNNEIMFCAAILEPPFFDPNRSDAMNYGAIGTVIGHELTHGFDDQGSQYDADGNLQQWMTKEDSIKFHEKLKLLINQYNSYTMDSLKLDGDLAISENTADLGGVLIAFDAMKNNLKKHPEGLIDGFTPEQRFFISYAQLGRQNITHEAIRKVIKRGYSPNIYRINGPLSNMPEFYKAFNVKPGDGMFRSNDIRAVIW